MNSNIYHEKQSKQMCALHSLNNLFQNENTFTKSDLDMICETLSPNSLINGHKSAFGFGNYDINVIMSALHSKHCQLIWFDCRKDPNCLRLQNINGFILNIPNNIDYNSCKKWFSSSIFSYNLFSSRKHWITIRSFDDNYYNLDSKLQFPELIGNSTKLIDFLREKIKSKDTEIFVVVSDETAEDVSWLQK